MQKLFRNPLRGASVALRTAMLARPEWHRVALVVVLSLAAGGGDPRNGESLVAALFVQYATAGDRGDLVRAFVDLPLRNLGRAAMAPFARRGERDHLLWPWTVELALSARKQPAGNIAATDGCGAANPFA